MTKRIPVKTFYLFGIIVISLIFLAARSTYAMFTASVTINDPITISSNLAYNGELIEYQTITIANGEEKNLELLITSYASSFTSYASWYTCLSGETACQKLVIGATDEGDPPSGNIAVSGGSTTTSQKRVKVKVRNDGNTNLLIRIGAVGGNPIVLSDEMNLIPEGYSEKVVHTVDIVQKLTGTSSTSSSVPVEIVSVDSGNDSQTITITGSSDFPTYKGTICTNNQTFSETTSTDSTTGITTVKITLKKVTSNAVCTVEFQETVVQAHTVEIYTKVGTNEIFVKNELINDGETSVVSIDSPLGATTYCGVTCTNGQSGSFNSSNNNLTLTNITSDAKCTISFNSRFSQIC